MAKKQYLVEDLDGHRWVVRPSDPAYSLVSTLKRALVVLPYSVLATGDTGTVNLEDLGKRLSRLARYADDDPDPSVLGAVQQASVAYDCLKELTNG